VREILKVFVHSPPPLERESIIRIVGFTIPEVTFLSTQKGGCENYLFITNLFNEAPRLRPWSPAWADEFGERCKKRVLQEVVDS